MFFKLWKELLIVLWLASMVYSVTGPLVFFSCMVLQIIEQWKILFRIVITINQNWACYKIRLGCSSDANQLLFEINRAVAIYASKGLGSFSFEWLIYPNYSFFFLVISARFQPVHSQSCGTQPVVNYPASHNSVLCRTGLVCHCLFFSSVSPRWNNVIVSSVMLPVWN